MRNITLEELLEAGCHFGHQVTRQNSKAREYIFEARDKVHIIDLEKTKEGLEDAGKFVASVAAKNGTMVVLSTKRQAASVLEMERKRLSGKDEGLYFVTKRWIGGTLTNFAEVGKNYKKLKELTDKLKDSKVRAKYTKKELSDWEKSRVKLESFYGGISELPAVPDALFIIDTHIEHVAAKEARIAGVPSVGITDTNADPTIIDYPIPANDDAVGSLQLIMSYIFDAWVEGKKTAKEEAVKQEAVAKKREEKVAKEEKVAQEEKAKSEAKTAEKAPAKKTVEKKSADAVK
jgi:small subunit ribosomal protein S2